MGVYVTRNSDTYLKGKMELSGNIAYGNGINGLVFHRTFRGFVKKNIVFDNGEVAARAPTLIRTLTLPS